MRFDVAYPERLSRWKTLLRGILIIPAWIYFALASSLTESGFVLGWIAVFLKRKYPSWLFAGLTGALAFNARTAAYGLLLTDRYPSFDAGTHPAVLDYASPPQGELSRWRVFFWKLLLLVPHLFVLAFLWVAVLAVTGIAWFAILVTGRYPRGLFGFATGVLRWQLRLAGYFASFTDRFPPFALSVDAGPAGKGAALASAIAGILLVGGCTGGIATVAILSDDTDRATVDYAALLDGEASQTFATGNRLDPTFAVRLDRATDPASDLLPLIDDRETRTIVFDLSMYNGTDSDREFGAGDARLRIEDDDGDRDWVAPALVVVGGEVAPADLDDGEDAEVRIAFAIPDDARPVRLRVEPPWPSLRGITYEFR
jgi:hypothetical protein